MRGPHLLGHLEDCKDRTDNHDLTRSERRTVLPRRLVLANTTEWQPIISNNSRCSKLLQRSEKSIIPPFSFAEQQPPHCTHQFSPFFPYRTLPQPHIPQRTFFPFFLAKPDVLVYPDEFEDPSKSCDNFGIRSFLLSFSGPSIAAPYRPSSRGNPSSLSHLGARPRSPSCGVEGRSNLVQMPRSPAASVNLTHLASRALDQ